MTDIWKDCVLGDVVYLKRGYDLPKKKRVDGEFPIVSSSGISGFHVEAKVKGPGVVTGRYGTLGEVFYISGDFWPLNTALYVQDFKGNNRKFISYFLKTLHLGTQNVAGAVPGVNRNYLHMLPVRTPPLILQQKIAAILSAYDDLIENNLRRIKILEEMTQNLYREWFVKFRFPGHAKVRMVDSPLGKIPEGWEVVTLGELVNIPKGKNITKKTIVPGDVPVVAGGIAPAYYHNAANTRNPVITISASGANAGFVNLYYHDVWASDCSVIDLSATKYVYYFYLLLKDRQYEVTRLQRGAAQPHVYPKDLMALDALSVPEEILEFFARKIGPIFKMIKNMKEKNKNLHQTRDLLLPKLISGELDISELEIDTGKEAA